jgi:predicted nucleic acid-binding protein
MNASPVVLLAKAGVIQFVPQICGQLIIPSGVVEEVRRAKTRDAGCAWLENEGAKFIVQPVPTPPILLSWDLGLGETQVLSWVIANRDCKAILDDLKARRCAEEFDLQLIGSLRVLLILKEHRLISAVRPAVNKFQESGFYFSKALIQQTLELAGEI